MHCLERARQICGHIVDIIFEDEDHDGCLGASEMATAFCRDMTSLERDYSEFAQQELDAIRCASLPAVVTDVSRLTLADAFDDTTVDALTLYYVQCLKEFSYRRTSGATALRDNPEAMAIRPRVRFESAAKSDVVDLCYEILRATAASVIARAHATRYVSARNSMRTVFSMTCALLFRDCPRGASMDLAAENPADGTEEASAVLSDPPLTRSNAPGSDTDTDAISAARNSWLHGAWSTMLVMTHGIEKDNDLPIDEKPEDMSAREWRQLRERRVRPEYVALLAAYLVRTMLSYDSVSAIAAAADDDNEKSFARQTLLNNLSEASKMHLSLFAFFCHRAMRRVERAEAIFMPTRIGDRWTLDDFERLIWLWPQWRGSVDRSRTTRHNAESTKPSVAVLREDARHLHHFRQTRSTITALPEEFWRPYDAQDTAACTRSDSTLSRLCADLCYHTGVAQSLASDPAVHNDVIDRHFSGLKTKADAVAREIERSVSRLRDTLREGGAPTYHQRAMVEAAMPEWPGDGTYTLASPQAPDTSAYVRMFASADGTVNVESSANMQRQFKTSRMIDTLQGDILLAQRALRGAQSLIDVSYESADTSYGEDVLGVTGDSVAQVAETLRTEKPQAFSATASHADRPPSPARAVSPAPSAASSAAKPKPVSPGDIPGASSAAL